MRVRVYPADRFGCGYFRLIFASEILRAQGCEIELVDPGERQLELRVKDEVVHDVVLGDDPPDVIVFQRVTHRFLTMAIPLIRSKGVAVVVDIDDDLTSIHPSNPAYNALHPQNEYTAEPGRRDPRRHSWHHLSAACREATLVTTSTPALRTRYAAHGRGRVIWNYLPDPYYKTAHTDSDLLGWPAAIVSHPDDPSAVGGAVARLVSDGHRFHVVGDPTSCGQAFGTLSDPSGVGGNINIFEWPKRVAEIGVGIAPLADTKFNQAKSWLKPLELSALGVPWVASPRAEYSRLHRRGAGLLAERPRVWYRELGRLLGSAELRADLAGRGREVADGLRLDDHVGEWWDAWAYAAALQRGDLPA
jgi:hypothetical protein